MTYRTLDEARAILGAPLDPDDPVMLDQQIDLDAGHPCTRVWIISTGELNDLGGVQDAASGDWHGSLVDIDDLTGWLTTNVDADPASAALLAQRIRDGEDTWSGTPSEDDLGVTVLWRDTAAAHS